MIQGLQMKTSAATRPEKSFDIWQQPLAFSTILLLYTDVFSGVIRWIFSAAGAAWLSYIPFGICILVIVFCFSTKLFLGTVDPKTATVPIFFLLYLVYGIIKGMSLAQTIFGLYTWTPFFTGVLLIVHKGERQVFRHFGVLWLCAVSGVFLNYFVDVPWTGISYDMAGLTVDAAQDWNAEGISRLVGFSRAHFTVANQISFFFVCLYVLDFRLRTKMLLWMVSLAAIFATTAKINIAAVATVPFFLTAFDFIRSRNTTTQSRSVPYVFAFCILLAFTAIDILPPFILSSGSDWVGALDVSGSIQFLTTSSLFERALYMWPDAFEQMARDRMPIEWLMGRGLGGIGGAQRVNTSEYFNAADNFFVFLYVTFGAVGSVFFLSIFANLRKLFEKDEELFRIIFASSITFLGVGFTSSNVESIVPALMLGMMSGKGLTSRFDTALIDRLRKNAPRPKRRIVA